MTWISGSSRSFYGLISLFFPQCWIIIHCLDVHSSYICSTAKGHLGCFQSIGIIKKGAITSVLGFGVHISFQLICINTKEHNFQILWLTVCLVLEETAKLSSKVAVPLRIPISSEWHFLRLFCPCQLRHCQCFGILHCNRCVVVPGCCNMQFSNDIMLHIFWCTSLPCVYLLGWGVLFRPLAYLLMRLVMFFLLSFLSFVT